MSNVLGQFGPSRVSKSADKTVSEFYYDWYSQIPEVMKPVENAECKSFVDLIHRSMFYISLNDKFLQEAICNLKVPNPTLKTYLDEAIAAESRRKSFNDIGVSSSNLDASGGVAISKWDASYGKKSHKSDHFKSDSKEVNHNKVGRHKAKSLIVKMPAKRIKTLLIRLRTRPDPGATSAVLKRTGLNIAN